MHLLCQRDRDGAKAIAKAWKMDNNPRSVRTQGWQSSHRDPMRAVQFFRDYILTSGPNKRNRMNNAAIREQSRRTRDAEMMLTAGCTHRVIP